MAAFDHLYIGEGRELTITVLVDKIARDISAGEYQIAAMEFHLALKLGGPIAISKTLANGGIVLLPQSGSTLGKAKIVLTTSDTRTLEPKSYYYEVVAMFAAAPTERTMVVDPSQVSVRPVVKTP